MALVWGDPLGYMVVDDESGRVVYAETEEDWDLDEWLACLADAGKIGGRESINAARDLVCPGGSREDRLDAQEVLGVTMVPCVYDKDTNSFYRHEAHQALTYRAGE